MPETPPRRHSARVLLFDARDRLLLIHTEVNLPEFSHLWLTPGGGVEPGETRQEAAIRELWEEAGITLEAAALGPQVWERTLEVNFAGLHVLAVEHFFVARVEAAEASFAALDEGEDRFLKSHRWWGASELAASDDVFAPRETGALIVPLLKGEYPAAPLQLGR